ncbi:DnaB-like helicase C-terminal domain-containing protein [Gemmiger formicilis]|uniref:DnaB-like helicase C-terminal domain-containing protein n=1 Tax=Gemmiger formicilis TaxID=745368 RepID=UPI003FD7CED6
MRKTDTKTLKSCLPQWLREHGLPLHKPFACLNPAHQDAHPSMGYNEKNQTVHCFACGTTYDIFDLVGQEENLTDFPSKMKAVNRRYGGGEVIRVTAKPTQTFPYKEGGGRSDPYFTGRGLSDETVRRFGLVVENGYAVLPVFVDGVCRSVCRRAIDPAVEPRYQNSRGAMQLWNRAAMERAAGKALFVTDGIFDALSLEELGFPAVALCGAANTGKLVQKIDEYVPVAWPERVILAGDADAAGQRMNEKLREQLTARGIACAVLALPDGCKDVNEALVQNRDALQAACEAAIAPQTVQEQLTLEDEFLAYLGRRGGASVMSTGIAGLDKALNGGLHAGLTVLGAVSSMGKTSLMLQMADTLAAAGRNVLFITIEMSRMELIAKSAVRGTRERARPLLDGRLPENKVRSLISAYRQKTGGRVELWEPDAPLTPAFLDEKVSTFCAQHESPVLFLDYLQLVAPARAGMTEKQTADAAVAMLKQLARRYDMPVMAASSLNREAYRPGSAEPGLSAFKESGSVEYSADLLLVLKYRTDADRENKTAPRHLALTILKNRFGATGESIPLDYEPEKELFRDGAAKATPRTGRNIIR